MNRHHGGDRAFVVQKHAATHLHYDLRLEVDGVLKSWAVPKGPSLNPGDKRLAMQVEDHPFEYRNFEGSIPKGEYGGGEMIIWDQGTYAPEGTLSVKDQLAKGDFKFQLNGERLRGSFVLVKLKKPGNKNEWLLIKHRDAFVDSEMGRGATRRIGRQRSHTRRHSRKAVQHRANGAPSIHRPLPGAFEAPMPEDAERRSRDARRTRRQAIFKPELGIRNQVGRRPRDRANRKRENDVMGAGRAATSPLEYPEFKDMAARFRARNAIIDGEIVTLDADGRSNFHTLQHRLGVQNPSRQLMQSVPLDYFAFDVMYADGYDLRRVPSRRAQRFPAADSVGQRAHSFFRAHRLSKAKRCTKPRAAKDSKESSPSWKTAPMPARALQLG